MELKQVDPCLLGTPNEGIRATMSIGINCPLKCKHCCISGVTRYSTDTKTNLNSLKMMGLSGVSKLYWDGAEPMTNKDIDTFLDEIANMKSDPNNPRYLFKRVSIATNGMYVDKEKASNLYQRGLRNVMVSLDGASEETHDFFRNKGSFNKAINAIEILKNQGFEVRIGSTLWKGILRELEDITKWGFDLDVEEIAFNWMQPVGRALEYPNLLVPNNLYQTTFNRLNSLSDKYKGKIKVSYHRGGENNRRSNCRGGKNIAYISGEWVWPCSWISLVSPEFRSELSLKDYSLKNILSKDPKIREFRRKVGDLERTEGALCPALCLVYNGSLKGPDPISPEGVHHKLQLENI